MMKIKELLFITIRLHCTAPVLTTEPSKLKSLLSQKRATKFDYFTMNTSSCFIFR